MKPNDTKTKQTKSSIIQYYTLHYNVQYNITNTIIQIEKTTREETNETERKQQKTNQMKRNQLYDTI